MAQTLAVPARTACRRHCVQRGDSERHHYGMVFRGAGERGRRDRPTRVARPVPGNGETFMLGRAFRLLRRTLPEVRAGLSYADPMERHDAAGKVIKCSHRGTINAAFSGVYLGRPSARPLILARDGRCINDRTPEQAAQRGMRRGLCRTPVGRHGRSCAPHVREGRGQRHARLAVRRVPACTNPGNYAFGWWLSHPTQDHLPPRGATPYPRDTCTDRDPRLAHLMGEARDVA